MPYLLFNKLIQGGTQHIMLESFKKIKAGVRYYVTNYKND